MLQYKQYALKELMLQYKQYALKELMLQYKQHALKGQKLLAQGTALGYYDRKPVALQGQKLSPKQKKHPSNI